MGDPVTLTLSKAEAIVLFEFLHDLEDSPWSPPGAAERLAVWRLVAALESTLVEPFQPDYQRLVARSRSQLAQQMGEDPA